MSDIFNTTGSARTLQNSSASTVLATLGPVAGYAAVFFLAFLLVRRVVPRLYYPRAFISSLPPRERSPPLPKGLFNWFGAFWETPDIHVLNTQSLDGYMFLRLLRISVACCIVGCIITWPILFPINITGVGGQTQLNILTFSNVARASEPSSYYRYYAHTFCAYIYFGFIIYMITRETIYYVNLRQAYLVSPLYANRISSRTVLFTAVPSDYLHEDVMRQLLGENIVRNVWIHRHISQLEDKVEERAKVAMMLEQAEIKLIKDANKARRKALKKGGEHGEELKSLRKDSGQARESRNNSEVSGTIAGRWLEPNQRPHHRLKFLIGKKVDTIDWARCELTRLIPEVEALQQNHREGKGKPHNSVFVEFESLRDAQSAYQSLTHHQAARMSPRFTGMFPEEIIWDNLRIKWWERVIRSLAATGIVAGLIIAWTFPVAAISAISNAETLAAIPEISWLGFLYNLPTALSGLVTGLLPTVLLAALMALLPMVLRFLARLSGVPTLSAVEYAVQNSYFWFQVIQVFLITTLAGGAFKTLEQIANSPQTIVTILAESLPASSNFYLSYITLQGLGVVSQTLLGIVSLLIYVVWGKLMDSTPRAKWKRWVALSNPGLGSVYPVYTTLLIIAISYSCIAPLVLLFATLGLTLFYLAFRYQFLYVYSIPYDTKGLMYARALQQLFVGLYLAELCLIGLFAIPLGKTKIVLGPLVLMCVFLGGTVVYHWCLNRAFRPLLAYLPKTLETEEQRLLAMESGHPDTNTNSGAAEKYRGPDTLPAHIPAEPINRAATERAQNSRKDGKKPNFIVKWLRPDIYTDYHHLRLLVPREFAEAIRYSDEEERETYFHPAVVSKVPVVWVPRDEAGVSGEECGAVGGMDRPGGGLEGGRGDGKDGIRMSDQAAWLDSKGNVTWDWEGVDTVPVQGGRVYW